MKYKVWKALPAVAAVLATATGVKAEDIATLFSTGMTTPWNASTPVPVAQGSADTHYTLLAGNPGGYGTTTFVKNQTGFPFGSWMLQTASNSSKWIQPNNGTDNLIVGPGNYTYRTIFTLEDGLGNPIDPSTAQIQFRVISDNNLIDVQLNSVSTGVTATGLTQAAFNSNTKTISSGFATGSNTLDFVVNNNGSGGGFNPSGLRVEIFSATGVAFLPEPASLGFMVLGGSGLLLLARRRRR